MWVDTVEDAKRRAVGSPAPQGAKDPTDDLSPFVQSQRDLLDADRTIETRCELESTEEGDSDVVFRRPDQPKTWP